jgi:hypothetical protein
MHQLQLGLTQVQMIQQADCQFDTHQHLRRRLNQFLRDHQHQLLDIQHLEENHIQKY